VIDLDGVAVDLGGRRIVEGVDLGVDAGEFLALVGPNGAGKTTTLRTVNGVLAPASGTVTVDGRPVPALSARETARLVATVPQETALGFDFDVRSLVEMGRTPHRARFARTGEADREAVERAMDRAGVAALADRPVGTLSGGERQRVLLARALAQETPALVLDEPTANLDVNHQVRTLGLVRDLVDEGRTAVAAIHDLDLAARFCDRMAVLAGGGVAACGPPGAVLTDETVEWAFDVPARVVDHPVTGTPSVTALDRRAAGTARDDGRTTGDASGTAATDATNSSTDSGQSGTADAGDGTDGSGGA